MQITCHDNTLLTLTGYQMTLSGWMMSDREVHCADMEEEETQEVNSEGARYSVTTESPVTAAVQS